MSIVRRVQPIYPVGQWHEKLKDRQQMIGRRKRIVRDLLQMDYAKSEQELLIDLQAITIYISKQTLTYLLLELELEGEAEETAGGWCRRR